jgi:hypothetical protein
MIWARRLYPSVADNCRLGGDPVAILEKQKAAPKGGYSI